MAVIDSDLIRVVIDQLKNNATVQTKIPKDSQDNYAIHASYYNPIHNVYPQITVEVVENDSQPSFLSCKDSLIITIWLDKKTKEQSYSFLKSLSDVIVPLFNREGNVFNEIDISTNTGVRFCQFLKSSVIFDYDAVIDKYFCEITFDVVRSEDESFLPSDAGDLTWI